jgi:putative membrane protein
VSRASHKRGKKSSRKGIWTPGVRRWLRSAFLDNQALKIVALILAIVNSYLKPILQALSFPITLISLGLFSLVLNALLLLLVAFVSNQLSLGFSIGGFPPDFTADAFIGALLGSIIISIVSTLLGMLNTGRKVVV